MTTDLALLVRDASRAVWAYVDASATTGAPASASASLRTDIRLRLEALHAAGADIDALDAALADHPGAGSPASRYRLVRDGRVEVDEVYPSAPLQSPLVGTGLVPDVVPLLRHRSRDRVAEVVRAARDDHGARGVGPVVEALRHAVVDTVAIEPGRLEDRTALALAAPPWIAMTGEDALGADIIGAVPASVAIARTAVLTDARLVFDDPEHPLDDSGVVAALRGHRGPDGARH